jgi:hypothetical protein
MMISDPEWWDFGDVYLGIYPSESLAKYSPLRVPLTCPAAGKVVGSLTAPLLLRQVVQR